jgi:UDP-N-acetylmuramoyl-tripeptide--D-alanyl-D-alanine ligase
MTASILWTAVDAVRATGGKCDGDWQVTGVSIDSRTVQAGDLFVALKGPNFDGHDFVSEALDKNAYAVVSSVPKGLEDDRRLLLVDDTMAALEALATAARERSSARILAITGSVGKTGTKEALRRALARDGRVHASEGNLNNQWGAPLSLARMPADSDYAVFELGMNHAGEIEPLSRMVRPHVVLITNIAAVHTEFFDSIEDIANAKAEIFAGLESGGIAILNKDDDWFDHLKGAARSAGVRRIMTFGEREGADVQLDKIVVHPNATCMTATVQGTSVVYKVGVPGRHWALNSLAVLAGVCALGADLGKAVMSLAEMSAPKGRGRRHHVESDRGAFELIDESYNASPVAVRAALEVLGAATTGSQGRRIAVLGDMLELGASGPESHRLLADDVAANKIDLVFACGPLMAELMAALPPEKRGKHGETADELMAAVLSNIGDGDAVLVKGSLGMKMAPIVEALLALGFDEAMARGQG